MQYLISHFKNSKYMRIKACSQNLALPNSNEMMLTFEAYEVPGFLNSSLFLLEWDKPYCFLTSEPRRGKCLINAF